MEFYPLTIDDSEHVRTRALEMIGVRDSFDDYNSISNGEVKNFQMHSKRHFGLARINNTAGMIWRNWDIIDLILPLSEEITSEIKPHGSKLKPFAHQLQNTSKIP